MPVTLDRLEMERLPIGSLVAEVDGNLAMAKMAEGRQLAASATVERLTAGLAELTRQHQAAGGTAGAEPVQAGNFREHIAEAKSDFRSAIEAQRRHEALASTLRLELGVCESLWRKAKGKESDAMKWIGEIVAEAIDTAPADRDAAEVAHAKTEEKAPQAKGESDLAYRERSDNWELRQAIRGPIAPAAHYASVLDALRAKYGLRIARLTQTRMWAEGLLPQGEGYLPC